MWYNWSIGRVIILFSGLAFLLIFIQVTLYHYRQNFRHWAMLLPVTGTPLIAMALIILAFNRTSPLPQITTFLLMVGLLAGLIGFYYHLRGVGQRVGGYNLQNFLVGPPLVLPLMVAALSVLGLLGIYWR